MEFYGLNKKKRRCYEQLQWIGFCSIGKLRCLHILLFIIVVVFACFSLLMFCYSARSHAHINFIKNFPNHVKRKRSNYRKYSANWFRILSNRQLNHLNCFDWNTSFGAMKISRSKSKRRKKNTSDDVIWWTV